MRSIVPPPRNTYPKNSRERSRIFSWRPGSGEGGEGPGLRERDVVSVCVCGYESCICTVSPPEDKQMQAGRTKFNDCKKISL